MANKIKLSIILPIIIVLVLVVYFFFSPYQFSFFPTCPIYKYAGFHCAGCGSQRALHHLLHLEIGKMLQSNLLLPLWIFLALDFCYNKVIAKKDSLLLNSKIPWTLFAFILLYMVCRNIPYEPFTYLAPTL